MTREVLAASILARFYGPAEDGLYGRGPRFDSGTGHGASPRKRYVRPTAARPVERLRRFEHGAGSGMFDVSPLEATAETVLDAAAP